MTSKTPVSLAGKCLADFQVPSFQGLKSTLPSWQVGSLCSWLGFSVSAETVTLWPLHLSSTWPGWAACFTDPGMANHRHISFRTALPTDRCLAPTHTPGSSLHTPGMGWGGRCSSFCFRLNDKQLCPCCFQRCFLQGPLPSCLCCLEPCLVQRLVDLGLRWIQHPGSFKWLH